MPAEAKAPYVRPRTREDCNRIPRPCPFVACRYHLWGDVTSQGGLRTAYGGDEKALHRMPETCALDVADRGGVTLETLARLQKVTRERIRQLEMRALAKLRRATRRLASEMGVFSDPADISAAEQEDDEDEDDGPEGQALDDM